MFDNGKYFNLMWEHFFIENVLKYLILNIPMSYTSNFTHTSQDAKHKPLLKVVLFY